ncbi:hypothetical protein PR202_gb25052 [Eleusine coracana subsp. coracana]|uniref:Uncharacterized protein n=1 Tax=Eleusine coracana subsp. coracana TaxID=191504 RepID=A0AAV5FMQ6_ELECO|nr:hypothetical protein QOZ80_5BG0454850 [Eleusine coracana subsp. coracana]GJN36212.1 hypothetical protein PR202_gb25052 [Eleusine coracana subsp. coracana]
MESFRKCSAIVAVFSLLLLACEARVLSGAGDAPTSSSSAAKHGQKMAALHDRKLLNTTADVAASWNATLSAMADRRITAPDECSEEAVVVLQDNQGPMPNGIPSYTVTITNTCLGCTVHDVHVACGEFASTELVSPSEFRRLTIGDCLVLDGGAMGPGDTIAFEYSNSFQYDMDVVSVSCG